MPENINRRAHLGNLYLGGRVTLKSTLNKGDGSIHLAQDTD